MSISPSRIPRANWASRPLPEEYLQYAAEDVEYLLPAFEELKARLDKAGRLGWAEADSQMLLDRQLYDIEPENAFARLKGARNLRGRRRMAAKLLATWREMQALERDRPRQWIMRDNVLVDIAHKLPANVKQLSAISDLPPKLLQRAGQDIVAAVANAEKSDGDYKRCCCRSCRSLAGG